MIDIMFEIIFDIRTFFNFRIAFRYLGPATARTTAATEATKTPTAKVRSNNETSKDKGRKIKIER